MPNGTDNAPGITVDATANRPLTQAFHELSGTGEPGTTVFVDLTKTPWGTVDPKLGTPESAGTGYRPPQIHGDPDHIVQVGEDGTWRVDLGEVPDGQYWVVVDSADGTAEAATTELKVWSSPQDRAAQRADRGLGQGPATGPDPEPVTVDEGPPNDLFTVDAVGTGPQSQAFHTVSGTGVPGQEIVVGVGGDRNAGSGDFSATHHVTVGEDGTWSVDLGELPDGDNSVQIHDPRGLFTETGTIPVWSSPGDRIGQQKANGVYVEPDMPVRYFAPDGSLFTEDQVPSKPAEPQQPKPPATAEEPTSMLPTGVWWLAGAAVIVLIVIALFAFTGGGDEEASPSTASTAGETAGESSDDGQSGGSETSDTGQVAGSGDTADDPGSGGQTPPEGGDPGDAPGGSATGFDYATVPSGEFSATFSWTTKDGCAETPADSDGTLVTRSTSRGLRVDLGEGAPRGAVLVGDGTAVATGFGGGGTTTRDGQTTKSTSRGEVLGVHDDGFEISAEAIRGPADENGNLIPGEEACTSGGVLRVTTDPDHWQALLALPTSEEPPIQIEDFGCFIETTSDGANLWFALAADVQMPLPDQPFSLRLDVFGRGVIQIMPEDIGSSLGDGFLFDMPGGPGTPSNFPPPAQLEPITSRGPSVWGSVPYRPGASEDPESLDSFTLETLMDVQPLMMNGPYATFGISAVCPVDG